MPVTGHRAGPGAAATGKVAAALAGSRPTSYWLDQADAPPAAPRLTGGTGAGLAVIGGGFTGLWAALLAVERDPSADVVLLEARRVGWAASGRNGGFCSASLTHGIANGIARFEAEMPALMRLGQQNLDEIAATVESHGIDCGFERTGELAVATAPWQLDDLTAEAAAAAGYGEQAMLLDANGVRAEVDSPTYLGGVWYPGSCAILDPARLAWGLRRACLESGVRIYENTPVRAITEDRGGLRLSTPRGSVHAGQAALGTGCYRPLLRRLRHYLVPVYDYALMTEPLSGPQLSGIGWRNRQGVGDSGNQFHYYRLTSDNRILWGGYDAVYYNGGRITAAQDQRPETFAKLAGNFFGTFPHLAGQIRFTHAWGGVIDTCSRFCAFYGTGYGKRLAYAAGYTGLGVGATRFGANVILDLLGGERTERTALAMVRTKPVPFPPEPVRSGVIQLTRASLARADRNEGRRDAWLRMLDRLGLGFDS